LGARRSGVTLGSVDTVRAVDAIGSVGAIGTGCYGASCGPMSRACHDEGRLHRLALYFPITPKEG
jgi:hypothetical protein